MLITLLNNYKKSCNNNNGYFTDNKPEINSKLYTLNSTLY